ncbi:putative AMP-dependent synthetase and ligase (plasmid) [Rhodococcus opacus]|uniref:Putative AMP-dependent synthetase and ligase n=1 Tax=Rhodococcus opacus TaxID=37919 RepID=A0A1B1KHX7_RHOOP|nr:class I adenylate-forming enzyme family protein [Rhodococcus opacus]ANS32222.1 putative AMP-dependent synthetase and ligase [Rhodococcus opacus]
MFTGSSEVGATQAGMGREELTPFDAARQLTLPAVVDAYAELLPQQVLVATDDGDLTAAQFRDRCRDLAAGLRKAGLPKGAPVGILLPNGWKWLVAVQAVAYAGLIAVPLNTWYKSTELTSAREQTGLQTVITQPDIRGRDNVELMKEADLLESDDDRGYLGAVLWDTASLPETLPSASADERPDFAVNPDDIAMYVFTSGSSAAPKVVVLHHEGLLRNGFEMGKRQQLTSDDKLWLGTPLFFGYGCANAMTVCLTHGATLCVQERFEPLAAARFIEERACTVYYGLGPITREIVNSGALNTFNLSSLRTGAIGLSAEEKRLALEDLGVTHAVSMYGLTECYGLCVMTEPGDSFDVILHSQGRPLPNHKVRCLDVESGTALSVGDGTALGEIQLHGCTTPGYLNNDIANAASFTPDGWFRTGDLGWIDAEGRLHFAGRLKEVVKVNGITISPAEVEAYVMEHPDVSQAHVFGWPSREHGEEELCCGVVLKDTAQTKPDDIDGLLRTWLKPRIASYKVPKIFVALTETQVPLTATGKVSKRLIGEQFLGVVSPD